MRPVSRFYNLYRTEAGYDIRGLIQPADEGQVPAYQWATPRLVLRVGPDSLAKVGDIIRDGSSRRFMLGEHSTFERANELLFRTFRLVECNSQVSWTRNETIIDDLTGLERESGQTNLGPIWVTLEQLGRLEADRTLRVKENPRQCITAADVRLNDQIDGQVVRRITSAVGLKLLELT